MQAFLFDSQIYEIKKGLRRNSSEECWEYILLLDIINATVVSY